jgi:hypothetical protein
VSEEQLTKNHIFNNSCASARFAGFELLELPKTILNLGAKVLAGTSLLPSTIGG